MGQPSEHQRSYEKPAHIRSHQIKITHWSSAHLITEVKVIRALDLNIALKMEMQTESNSPTKVSPPITTSSGRHRSEEVGTIDKEGDKKSRDASPESERNTAQNRRTQFRGRGHNTSVSLDSSEGNQSRSSSPTKPVREKRTRSCSFSRSTELETEYAQARLRKSTDGAVTTTLYDDWFELEREQKRKSHLSSQFKDFEDMLPRRTYNRKRPSSAMGQPCPPDQSWNNLGKGNGKTLKRSNSMSSIAESVRDSRVATTANKIRRDILPLSSETDSSSVDIPMKTLKRTCSSSNVRVSSTDSLPTKRRQRRASMSAGTKKHSTVNGWGKAKSPESRKIEIKSPGSKKKKPTKKEKQIQEPEPLSDLGSPCTVDRFCWQCHQDGNEMIACSTCERVYHLKCLKMAAPSSESAMWVCPVCVTIMKAEDTATRMPMMQLFTVDELCELLKYPIMKMKKFKGSGPFQEPVDTNLFPMYRRYVVRPMDLSLLERNVQNKVYGSTEALEADAQWILHNCTVFNSRYHELTYVARRLVKLCSQQLRYIKNCPECYVRNMTRDEGWFMLACRRPHLLLWCKLGSFPFWPAKLIKAQGSAVDVRFFADYDRAFVNLKDCFVISKKAPLFYQRKKTSSSLMLAMQELEAHVENLQERFGKFEYSPHRTPFVVARQHEHLRLQMPDYRDEAMENLADTQKNTMDEDVDEEPSSNVDVVATVNGNREETSDLESESESESIRSVLKVDARKGMGINSRFDPESESEGEDSYSEGGPPVTARWISETEEHEYGEDVEILEDLSPPSSVECPVLQCGITAWNAFEERSELSIACVMSIDKEDFDRADADSDDDYPSFELPPKESTSDLTLIEIDDSSSLPAAEPRPEELPTPSAAPPKYSSKMLERLRAIEEYDRQVASHGIPTVDLSDDTSSSSVSDKGVTDHLVQISNHKEDGDNAPEIKSTHATVTLDHTVKPSTPTLVSIDSDTEGGKDISEQRVKETPQQDIINSIPEPEASLSGEIRPSETISAEASSRFKMQDLVTSKESVCIDPFLPDPTAVDPLALDSSLEETAVDKEKEPTFKALTSLLDKISSDSFVRAVNSTQSVENAPKKGSEENGVSNTHSSLLTLLAKGPLSGSLLNGSVVIGEVTKEKGGESVVEAMGTGRADAVEPGPDGPRARGEDRPSPGVGGEDPDPPRSQTHLDPKTGEVRSVFLPHDEADDIYSSGLFEPNVTITVLDPRGRETRPAERPKPSTPTLGATVNLSGAISLSVVARDPEEGGPGHDLLSVPRRAKGEKRKATHDRQTARKSFAGSVADSPHVVRGATSDRRGSGGTLKGNPEHPWNNNNSGPMVFISSTNALSCQGRPPFAGNGGGPLMHPADPRSSQQLVRMTGPRCFQSPHVPPEASGPTVASFYAAQARMAQLMMDIVVENGSCGDPTLAEVAAKIELEKRAYFHMQEINELKRNFDQSFTEMRAAFSAKLDTLQQQIMEERERATEERERAIVETKSKQWCTMCLKEAQLYCCWNTAYCNYVCQNAHWPNHILTCGQQKKNEMANGVDAPDAHPRNPPKARNMKSVDGSQVALTPATSSATTLVVAKASNLSPTVSSRRQFVNIPPVTYKVVGNLSYQGGSLKLIAKPKDGTASAAGEGPSGATEERGDVSSRGRPPLRPGERSTEEPDEKDV